MAVVLQQMCAQRFIARVLALALSVLHCAASEPFLRHMKVHKADAEMFLDSELEHSDVKSMENIQAYLKELQSIGVALPKVDGDRLDPVAVRYALHRFFMDRSGWWIKGLEPNPNGTWRSKDMMEFSSDLPEASVPVFLLDRLQAKHASNADDGSSSSVSMIELAELAAAIDDLASKEAADKVEALFNTFRFPKDMPLDQSKVDLVLKCYLTSLLRRLQVRDVAEAEGKMQWMADHQNDWDKFLEWMRGLDSTSSLASDKNKTFDKVVAVVQDIGKQFGRFNDAKCLSMKGDLMELTGRSHKPGRVRLPDLYNRSFSGVYRFTEKVEFLRSMGSLDETDSDNRLVIIPNYVTGVSNCGDSTSLFKVCCRNECEKLLSHLEQKIAGPYAPVQRVLDIVQTMSSSTVSGPRELTASMVGHLESLAQMHGGKVPLHSRLFSLWLHHAFPNECPFPRESGLASPQIVSEWLQDTGHESIHATTEEMLNVVAADSCSALETGPCTSDTEGSTGELPWSEAEELFAISGSSALQAYATLETTSQVIDGRVDMARFGAIMVFVVIAGVAGMAMALTQVERCKGPLAVVALTALSVSSALAGFIDVCTLLVELIVAIALIKAGKALKSKCCGGVKEDKAMV